MKNQRDLLKKHLEEFENVFEYVDDGHTGTDTNREDFQRLLADVMSGKINCVVVKALSRFARNYSDAGSLAEKYRQNSLGFVYDFFLIMVGKEKAHFKTLKI